MNEHLLNHLRKWAKNYGLTGSDDAIIKFSKMIVNNGFSEREMLSLDHTKEEIDKIFEEREKPYTDPSIQMSEEEMERRAKKLGETLESIKEEAKRLHWSPEYLIIHWEKENTIAKFFN